MSDIAIRVEDLSKVYRIGVKQEKYRTLRDTLSGAAAAPFKRVRSALQRDKQSREDTIVWALKDVSFEVKRGEVVGVIGRNGAGKSTLLKILSRITEPSSGRAEIHGRVGSLLEVGTGFHPELTGRENIRLNGAILGMKRVEIERRFDEIVDFAEVEKFIDTPVKHYSSGMYLRLAFAVAAHMEPEILLVDEVLAVGDAQFQKKCLGKMGDVANDGRTVLFVSHNMGAIRDICRSGIFLNEGSGEQFGNIAHAIERYYRSIGFFTTADEGSSTPNARASVFGSIRVNDGNGNSVKQASAFVLSTSLYVEREVSGFRLYCIIENIHGQTVICLLKHSSMFGLQEVPAGEYEIGLEFPVLWLTPGLYAVHFKVFFSEVSNTSRYVSDKIPLDVDGDSSVVDTLLHPHTRWSVLKKVKKPQN